MFKIIATALVISQVADIITTNGALARGGIETNKYVRKWQAKLGNTWWIPKALLAGLAVYLLITVAKTNEPLASMAGLVALVFYTRIIYNNTRVGRK